MWWKLELTLYSMRSCASAEIREYEKQYSDVVKGSLLTSVAH